jgi:uncharacterized protein YukE
MENTRNQLNEIRKTMQDIKGEFNKVIESWGGNTNWSSAKEKLLKSNKKSVESISSRLNQVEDKILGLEDK